MHAQRIEISYPNKNLYTTRYHLHHGKNLGADLFSLKKREFMVLVDYMSKFVVVAQLERIDSPCVIKKLKNIFACHGIPKELFSDGGPQFTSSLFNEFSKQWDFKHNRSSPHYPQSNGQAERTVQTVKKALKTALETGEDPYLALLTINNTPERLFGRQTRTQTQQICYQ